MACYDMLRAYAKAKFMMKLKTKSDRLLLYWRLCLVLTLLASPLTHAASPWEQPAAQLTSQVAEILGSGQAQLVVNNRSTIGAQEIPVIRRLLEQSLRARGVIISGTESANLIRVTLSENVRERLWVAEVIEGTQTQVAMVHVDREAPSGAAAEAGMVLQKKRVWSSTDVVDSTAISNQLNGPLLAALETHAGLVLLEQEAIVVLTRTPAGWHEEKQWNLDARRPLSRDPRGLLRSSSDGNGFVAITPGRKCDGSYAPPSNVSMPLGEWSVRCRDSDDPWPIETGPIATVAVELHAFYNASRDFFTGVIAPNSSPGQGIDLMPFFTIAAFPQLSGDPPALLVNGIDGKVQLMEEKGLRTISGTRDWGSDFAVLHTGCGAGTQIITSSSGEAESDSLRAYELPIQEAVAVSAPLAMGGTITAMWTSPEYSSVLAVIRKTTNEYEVDRVSVLCP